MSLESVRRFFATEAPDIVPQICEESTATVSEAAKALGVQEGQIAKTLALKVGDERLLLVMAGTGRLDNRKTRDALGGKPRMLPPEEVAELTGHAVGGVCPFGLPQPIRVVCDVSLRAYDAVWPAAGDRNSAVRLTPDRLARLVHAEWVDVCQS